MTTNPLHSLGGSWIAERANDDPEARPPPTDRNGYFAEAATGGAGGGTLLTITANRQGTPFNVWFDAAADDEDGAELPPPSLYFEVIVREVQGNDVSKSAPPCSLAVGVARRSEFLPGGWRTRGMFYNGRNATNGAAALIVGFGERALSPGDTVGVYCRGGRDGCRGRDVVFYHNGRCLGAAFSLSRDDGEGEGEDDAGRREEAMFPCLHVGGGAPGTVAVEYSTPTLLPTNTAREQSPQSHGSDRYVGDWKLTRVFAGPELGEFPLPHGTDVVLSLTSNEVDEGGGGSVGGYELGAKVANRFHARIGVVGKDGDGAFDRIAVAGGVAATKMMPPPELERVEKFLSSALPTLYKMIVNSTDGEEEEWIATGPAAELICRRYEKTFEPRTTYH